MAQQAGILPIKGTLGNITFYKSRTGGYLVREKGGVDASRIASDPAFARTRENGEEFKKACKAGRILRVAFRTLMQNASDSLAVARLVKAFSQVIKADLTSVRGQRNVIDGEAELLTGFEFNAGSTLQSTLFAPFSVDIDRATGNLTVELPPFIPDQMIAVPGGATHFVISCGGAEIDFEAASYVNGVAKSNELPINSLATAALNLTVPVTANSTKPLFVALGIQFIQQVNGVSYSLKNGTFNALAIVAVSGTP